MLVEVFESLFLGVFLCDEVLEEFFLVVDKGGWLESADIEGFAARPDLFSILWLELAEV